MFHAPGANCVYAENHRAKRHNPRSVPNYEPATRYRVADLRAAIEHANADDPRVSPLAAFDIATEAIARGFYARGDWDRYRPTEA